VPFCKETASQDFTICACSSQDAQQYVQRLLQAVPWDNVLIVHDEAGGPEVETVDARRERCLTNFKWDPYLNIYMAVNPAAFEREPLSLGDTGEMHLMRSFSPASMANQHAPAAGRPDARSAPASAARIHVELGSVVARAAAFCWDPSNWLSFYKHVLLVWMSHFWKASTRFVDDSNGMMAVSEKKDKVRFFSNGMHFMHGSRLSELCKDPSLKEEASEACDIVILRPNIEHEMLGVIMGHGGTQELDVTFWGQTELSCYDNSQHNIWGMSYKYHERAMVTNERNMIRAYDVAYDGYDCGMDQSCVDWNDIVSRKSYSDSTYEHSKPYSCPSMLVMALPVSLALQAWPNLIVFHADMNTGYSPNSKKSQGALPNMHEHMVFNSEKYPRHCMPAMQECFTQYMVKMEMTQWANVDQLNQPAGESCVANELTSTPMAFQGSMRVLQNGVLIEDIKGSGHLGHSYVGIVSVGEGRGVLNPAAQHTMMRMV